MRSPARFDGPVKAALGAAAVAALVWWLVGLAFAPTLHTLEEHATDLAWRLQASDTRERRVILIDIDEASLSQFGSWPWSRDRIARLSDRLANEGAALQIFDVVFSNVTEHDAALAATLQKNQAVLAQVFALTPNAQASSGQPAAPLPTLACPPHLTRSTGFIANAPAFAQVPMGHITPTLEPDGSVRHQPALICHQGKVYPALFIAAFAQALNQKNISLSAPVGLLAPHWRLDGISFDPPGLPLDAAARVRIPWTLQPDAFISLSAADVLQGRVPQHLLTNAWVLIGSTALGLNDRIASPFSGNTAGLLVHAQLLRGALDGRIPYEPRFADVYTGAVALGCVLVLGSLGRLRKKPVYLVPLVAVVLVGVIWLGKAWLLVHTSVWLGWLQPTLFILMYALSLSLIEFARGQLERARLYSHLASYLPRPVAEALARQDPSDAVDATRRTITVLFSGIRNFAAYCETHPPEQSTAVLHAFFSSVTRQVEQYGGVIEFFQGDAVLAVWGSSADDAAPAHALSAARAILRDSYQLLPVPDAEHQPALALGIGLETGPATVGSFGLARRRTHLAIGHPVTAAARLQEMTAELAHPILIGEGMASALGNHGLVSQGMFLLEGLQNPSHIYAYPLRDCVVA